MNKYFILIVYGTRFENDQLCKNMDTEDEGPSFKLMGGIFSIILAILSIIWSPYKLILSERLNMTPGLPCFEWWVEPPPAGVKIYLYNITNSDRFLNGVDSKLLLEEVGPILYKEIWRHQNIVFNDNGTMSYFANKTLIYNPEENSIDLNATIVVPNIGVLLAISFLWDSSIITKFGLNSLFRALNSKPIINTTVYNFLENNSDHFLDLAHSWAPFLAPVKNAGIMKLLYRDFSDNVTMFIGQKHGDQLFSLIDKYHSSSNIPDHRDSCKFKITNSSEGVMYNQRITKDTILRYYRKSLCKVVSLYYEKESYMYGLKVYKFTMSKNEFNRIYPIEDDCFNSHPSLPNGISDVSKCLHSFPVSTSFVYFNHTDGNLKTCAKIEKPPNKSVPLPHIYVEPITGVPLGSSAGLQANIHIRPLNGFNKMFDKFSDQVIPLFWAQYYTDSIPLKVLCLIHLTLALPIIGWILTITMFIIGILSIWKLIRRKLPNQQDKDICKIERTVVYEQEILLK